MSGDRCIYSPRYRKHAGPLRSRNQFKPTYIENLSERLPLGLEVSHRIRLLRPERQERQLRCSLGSFELQYFPRTVSTLGFRVEGFILYTEGYEIKAPWTNGTGKSATMPERMRGTRRHANGKTLSPNKAASIVRQGAYLQYTYTTSPFGIALVVLEASTFNPA